MKFNPDKNYQKHRDVQGGVWFMQGGHRFSIAGKHLGRCSPEDTKKDLEKEEKKKRKKAQRRKEKLDAFSENTPAEGSIAEALKENRAAAAAEEAGDE